MTARIQLVAEFDEADALARAARALRDAPCGRMEAYTPIPMPEVDEFLSPGHGRIGLVALMGGLAGAALIYLLQVYLSVYDYPINVGGRPPHSWPAFIPATVALALLGAAVAAFAALLWTAGLPRYHHPVGDAPNFARASQDRYFLALEFEARDPDSAVEAATARLRDLAPLHITRLSR